MKFSSVQKDVRSLLASGYYRVPRFQRPYSWTREELDEFWSDAIVEGRSGYFVGSIVLFKDGPGVFGIVDGQQRLTSITILLCAIRDAFAAEGFAKLGDGLHTMIERPDVKSLPQYIIQPDSSHRYFEEYIQKRDAPDLKVKPGDEQKGLELAREFISQRVEEAISGIRSDSTLTDKQKLNRIKKQLEGIRDKLLELTLILVELDNESDAYLVFETLNARGMNLRVSDLVKNHLAKSIPKKTKTVDTVRDRWGALMEVIEGSGASISVDSFIHHHWLSTRDFVGAKSLFKSIRSSIKKPDANRYFNNLIEEAPIYRDIFEPRSAKWARHEAAIRDSLHALTVFQVRQASPLVLSVMACLRNRTLKPKHVADVLNAVEVFHFEFTAIASQSSSGGISKMYASHARAIRDGKTLAAKAKSIVDLKKKLRARLPGLEEFAPAFVELSYSQEYTRDKKLVRYTLGKLARHGLRSKAIDYEEMTIEHVAPQSDRKLAKELVASIGNLVLVDGDLNTRLADKSFGVKKPAMEKAAEVWVDGSLRKAKTWGKSEIEARAQMLAKLAYKSVWKI
jgi:hypothetical protein